MKKQSYKVSYDLPLERTFFIIITSLSFEDLVLKLKKRRYKNMLIQPL